MVTGPVAFRGIGADILGGSRREVDFVVDDDRLVLHGDADTVLCRRHVLGVRVRWPRPRRGVPVAPLVSVRTVDDPSRWRGLFWGPARGRPGDLRRVLQVRGWPLRP